MNADQRPYIAEGTEPEDPINNLKSEFGQYRRKHIIDTGRLTEEEWAEKLVPWTAYDLGMDKPTEEDWNNLAPSTGLTIEEAAGETAALFIEDVEITQDVLRDRWIDNHPDICFDGGSHIYRQYKEGRWTEVSEDAILLTISELVISHKHEGVKLNKAIVESVAYLIKQKITVSEERWNANPNIVVVRNGTLFLSETGDPYDTGLWGHSPKDYATRRMDFDYDPEARMPSLLHVLEDATRDPDVLRMLQEWVGYCLTVETKYQIMLWIEGPPASGKTTFLEAIVGMLGELAADVPITATVDRFGLSNIEGKTLLYSDDQTLPFLAKVGTLSKLVTGGYITVEEKYKPQATIRATGKVMWIMNAKPVIRHSETFNTGIWRRLKLIMFRKNYDELDVDLGESAKSEQAGLLNWAIEGLNCLRAQGRWMDSSESVELVSEYRGENFTISLWFGEECVVEAEGRVRGMAAYQSYVSWCRNTGRKSVNNNNFAKALQHMGYESRKSGPRGENEWHGFEVPQAATLTVDFSH